MSSFVKNVALLRHAIFFMFFWGKGCNFFLFCDVFRRITTQKQLFFADLRDCVALGMEYFSAYATFLDFGDNLRCMKQVAGLAGAPRNLLICDTMQPRRQSLRGHGLSPYKKTISHCFLRERALDEAAWVCFFAWLELSKLLVYYVNIFLACLDFYCKLIF